MEKKIIASQTISGTGILEFTTKCKQAEKDGWEMLGNPLSNNGKFNQVVVKYKYIKEEA